MMNCCGCRVRSQTAWSALGAFATFNLSLRSGIEKALEDGLCLDEGESLIMHHDIDPDSEVTLAAASDYRYCLLLKNLPEALCAGVLGWFVAKIITE